MEELLDLEIASVGKARSGLSYEAAWASEYLDTLIVSQNILPPCIET